MRDDWSKEFPLLCYIVIKWAFFLPDFPSYSAFWKYVVLFITIMQPQGPCAKLAIGSLCWGSVTWKRFGPLDNPQQLFFTQPVEAVEEVGNIRLSVIVTCAYNIWLNVFQDAHDLLGELNLADARDASHGSQGLIVIGHSHVGLKHQGRSKAQGFHAAKTL